MPYFVIWELCRSFKYFIGDPYDATGPQPLIVLPVEPGYSASPGNVSCRFQIEEKPTVGHLGEQVFTAPPPGACIMGGATGSVSSPTTGGFFANGSGFYFHKPVMNEVHEHHGPGSLQEMVQHIIPGTEFNSSERDDPPRCHPDTRTNLLDELQARIHIEALGTRIIWLVGPAGVGKSAIMQTLAETVCPLSTLNCVTLFFSRANHRDDPKKIFTTLAYGFAVADPEYRRYMAEKLAVDPKFLEKSLDEQFKRLFVTPFTTKSVNMGARRWVVILDGLDECKSEKEQCRIVDLIREFVHHHGQSTPFVWIIASRPEAHLQASFRRVEEHSTQFWKLEVPVDSEEALRSVELYLRTEFSKIRHNYSDIVPLLWPSENDFLWLMKASSGLFVFASTLVDYVNKGNPVLRLRYILSRIGRSTMDYHGRAHETKNNPFYCLDILYTAIMSDIPSDFLPTTKTILASYLIGDLVLVRNWNLLQLCNILGLEQHEAYAALRTLHSVLAFPPPSEAYRKPVQFIHDSFRDFLTDRSRSQSYHIDLDEELGNMWRSYVKTLKLVLADRLTLSWDPPSADQKSEVRDTIVKEARFQWLRILVRFYHDPSCQHGTEHRLSLGTSELIEAFEKLRPIFFECIKFHVGAFCGWLSTRTPVAFRQRMILREFDVTELTEHDLDSMFQGLCRRQWGCLIYSPALATFDLTDLNSDRWRQAKRQILDNPDGYSWGDKDHPVNWSVLANLLRPQKTLVMARPRGVMIVRLGPVEYYAIIGPLALRPSLVGHNINYLVFPYHIAS